MAPAPSPSVVATVPRQLFARRWLATAGVVVAVALAYAGALRAPFLFDDIDAVVRNPTIRDLSSWTILNPPADGSATTGRPIVNASFALNHALSGDQPWSYHALNVVLHALAALTLMALVRRTVLRLHGVHSAAPAPVRSDDRVAAQSRVAARASLIGFATALVWSLHPLQTETVACIAQRTEGLCALFYLLTLHGFVRAVDAPESRRRWQAMSVIACLLGMATKEVMVTAPLLVLLYDRTFAGKSFASALRQRRAYYAALASTWCLLAWLVARAGGARGTAGGFGLGVSAWKYLLTQGDAVLLYLKLTLWPHPLVLDYGTDVSQGLPASLLPCGIVLALLAATAWALWKRPAAGFVGACGFGLLAPSSSIVPLVTQTMAEHRMYLPLAALVAAAVTGLVTVAGRRAAWSLLAAALAFGALTVLRLRDYRDNAILWSDTVAKRPTNPRAHANLAWTLQQQGRAAEADLHYARAVALQPHYVTAHFNWGVALLERGRPGDAIPQFEAALHDAPGHVDALVNLGSALVRTQRAADAVPLFERALQLRPAADVHHNLGVALVDLAHSDAAAVHFTAALRLDPRLADAQFQLARLAERAGRRDEAEAGYAATLRLAPDHAPAHTRLGLLLARAERLDAAAEHFRAVIRLAPRDADAQANLGNVLLLQGRTREAIAAYEAALRLRPDDARLRESLALAREALR